MTSKIFNEIMEDLAEIRKLIMKSQVMDEVKKNEKKYNYKTKVDSEGHVTAERRSTPIINKSSMGNKIIGSRNKFTVVRK